ncbi:hypothetical protein PENTCL1PPCAC_26424, partial [Pristionchus entomophagus]
NSCQMDLSVRNLKEVHQNFRSVLDGVKNLPVTQNNQKEMIDLLDEMEKEDLDITIRIQAYEELEHKKEVGDTPNHIEKAVVKMMKKMDKEGRFAEEIKELKDKFERGEEEEDEIEVESATYSKKDPITKEDIKDPVKNSRCGHVYDRDSVTEFIKMHKKNRMALYQCPVQGCGNKVNLDVKDFVDFPDFFKLCS